ncbi:putative lyase [bacterium BMS3Bbin06]|nr:putative lyase [bacterium BMS3Abin08]GBE35023.1 putative lyase [bacterium BMS3Bbin06]HDO36440.1 hypothetical protein [Nitrospirota bacterium]
MNNEKLNRDIELKRSRIFSQRGRSEGLSVIIDSFKDESWRVRKTALDVLMDNYPAEGYIRDLINLLYLEDNAGARNTAIEALTRLGKKGLPNLIKAFDTDNRDVRKFIIDVIGIIGGTEVTHLLLKAIRDEDENVRASAVEYLGKLREPSVTDALINIIEEEDVWTAYPAVNALGMIGDRKVIPFLIKSLGNRPLTEPALRSLSAFSEPDTLQYVIPLLRDQRRSIQEETLRTIERYYENGVSEEYISERLVELVGADAFEICLKYTSHNNPEVKKAAIITLGLLHDHRAVMQLLDLAEDENLRDIVKRALVFMGKKDPGLFPELLHTVTPEKRRLIVDSMADIGAPGYIDIFTGLLHDRDGHVIVHAVRGLGRIGDKKAVDNLLSILGHPYPDVQEALIGSLTKLKDRIDPSHLMDGLRSANEVIRRNSVTLLGELRSEYALQELSLTLGDPSVGVRTAAVTAISRIRWKDTLKYIKMALSDESPEVREVATGCLAIFDNDEALEALRVMAKDSEGSVRAMAARTLSSIRNEGAVETLINLLHDRNGFVVTQAIESLSAFNHPSARKELLGLLNFPDREIKRTAIMALSSYSGVEDAVKPFLFSEDWATRLAAVQALSRMGTEKARECLEGIYDIEDDPSVKREIEDGLGV